MYLYYLYVATYSYSISVYVVYNFVFHSYLLPFSKSNFCTHGINKFTQKKKKMFYLFSEKNLQLQEYAKGSRDRLIGHLWYNIGIYIYR